MMDVHDRDEALARVAPQAAGGAGPAPHGDDPHLGDAAALLAMMAHPVRLKILCTLHEREWSVVRLAETLSLTQPNLSHHLKKLRDAGLVTTRREAQTIHYGLADGPAGAVLATLHAIYCGGK